MDRPPTTNDLQLISSNGVSLVSLVWVDWQAARYGTQSSLQTRNNQPPSEKTWQWLHSYGKSHTVPVVTWSHWGWLSFKEEGRCRWLYLKATNGLWRTCRSLCCCGHSCKTAQQVEALLCAEFKSSNSGSLNDSHNIICELLSEVREYLHNTT